MPLQLNNLDDDYVEVATTSSVSPELRDQVLGVDDSLQICSIVCSLLIIVGYVFIRTVDKTLDRLSLRLLIYSCFFNIIFGICQLFLNKNYVLADRACDAVMAFFVLSDMATALLLTCIAINLYLHIVHKAQIKASARVLETIYVVGTIILTGFMAITPFFAPDDVYNYNENLRQCWFVTSLPPTPMEIFWQLWLFHLWQLIGVLAALFAFISVIVNLRREEISIDEHIASAQVTANKWTCGDDKISPNLAEQAHSNTDQEHSSEERNIKDTKRHSVVSNFSRRTVEKGREKCIHWLKFWLPRRAFSSHREIRNTAIHASIRNSRNISYVAKTIRQVICYSLGTCIHWT
jgi:7 transmembrane receptor (rhodopsin family)